MELIPVDTHITAIDHGLMGIAGVGVSYVVRGDAIALIETGTSLTVPQTLAGLAALGIAREAVNHIIVTHVHMDHAGGAGYLAEALPNAQVYIHSMTAAHLIDPSRLMPSVRRAVGEEAWPLHGDCLPIPAERVVAAEHLELDLGQDIVLRALATPGHAPDHVAYRDSRSGGLFIGDAAGLHMPRIGVTLPVTPPPTYSLDDHRATIALLQSLNLPRMYLTHCGPYDNVAERLSIAAEQLEALVALVDATLDSGPAEVSDLARRWLPFTPTAEGDLVARCWSEMSVAGMLRYAQKRRAG